MMIQCKIINYLHRCSEYSVAWWCMMIQCKIINYLHRCSTGVVSTVWPGGA